MTFDPGSLDFTKGDGLVTVVTQDAITGAVLMIAHADAEAIAKTIETGEMHYRSRTRGFWHKGATSGNIQRVVSLTADCDGDAILARVSVVGPACHTGQASCFGDEAFSADALATLASVIAERQASFEGDAKAESSYTKRLLSDRNLRLKKIGEEATEFVTACADDDRDRAVEEAADLIYHTLVALKAAGAGLGDLQSALWKRRR
jgi:phosphoribosyl-ATP pyrophosphohydrolase/phosphoribosyl-AMP cyclohydrolase